MAILRSNVNKTKAYLKARNGLPYGYGGQFSDTDLKASTDCSGLAYAGVAGCKGLSMARRYGSTEALRVGSWEHGNAGVNSFGLVHAGSDKSKVPANAVVKLGLQHGGGGMYSHVAITIDGVNAESRGAPGGVIYGTVKRGNVTYFARAWNDPLFHDFWYLPGPIVDDTKPVVNEIDAEAKRASAWIGKRVIAEKPTPDGKGRQAHYEHGSIYWHPNVRAHKPVGDRAVAIPAHVMETWGELGYEVEFGYPLERHTVIAGVGDIQAFQGGVIYRKYGQPGYFITGRIWDRFAATDFERGNGWPQSNEHDFDGGQVQRFEKLDMAYHPSEVTRLARGKVAGEWRL
ncbi:endolysin [Gordonia phage TZGordon]|uniref:Lysin A n=1 Tax=Gordonia phage TZGordon TaxID=2744004 RepID=A0A6N0A576_9CAUD|nr:endolysin [Gordonia phage TZGordon]QKO02946.1 lysin A [Gordonia phage TZGordon]